MSSIIPIDCSSIKCYTYCNELTTLVWISSIWNLHETSIEHVGTNWAAILLHLISDARNNNRMSSFLWTAVISRTTSMSCQHTSSYSTSDASLAIILILAVPLFISYSERNHIYFFTRIPKLLEVMTLTIEK